MLGVGDVAVWVCEVRANGLVQPVRLAMLVIVTDAVGWSATLICVAKLQRRGGEGVWLAFAVERAISAVRSSARWVRGARNGNINVVLCGFREPQSRSGTAWVTSCAMHHGRVLFFTRKLARSSCSFARAFRTAL